MILPRSPRAADARALVDDLQRALVGALRAVAPDAAFQATAWLRDGGAHGGGVRYGVGDHPVFGRASVNVSQVHYDDLPERKLASATALSAIVHPAPARAPSMHVHASFTELRDGAAYWRVMADLNPSNPDPGDATRFRDALREAAGGAFADAEAAGDRYFEIPAARRRRGVAHFYVEGLATSFEADLAFAGRVERAAIGAYQAILTEALARPVDDGARAAQRAYHTLYLYQVLVLDRGTTSGLLVHDQNDLGILGSLPPRVDPAALAALAEPGPPVFAPLVAELARAVGAGEIDDAAKGRLAAVVRAFFRANPGALDLQASGGVVPPTVANHR